MACQKNPYNYWFYAYVVALIFLQFEKKKFDFRFPMCRIMIKNLRQRKIKISLLEKFLGKI